MFCNKCGEQLTGDASFCPKCGTPVAYKAPTSDQTGAQAQPMGQAIPTSQPFSEPTFPQSADQQAGTQPPTAQTGYYAPVSPVAPQNDYSKMGGWLLFFMVVNIIGAIAAILVAIAYQAEMGQYASLLSLAGYDSLNGIMATSTIATIVLAIAQLYFVYLVFKKKDVFLKFYQILSIASIAVSLILVIMLSSYGVSAQTIMSIISSIIGLVLLTYYYCKSVRVRTYMGSTEYQRLALFRIGA